ncbi:hypothetical protein [Hazenella coriacea]|uniref:Uncharacterized protein n=1 Tax=Hazenella coriacea TaxID=1179467 RepID=A0A4R3LAE0_9BACL|nr:hypothetical protein [Hazenella coriacea]TCS96813.1 hypothetical protein EDD58_101455 [Hazenella coriacea]
MENKTDKDNNLEIIILTFVLVIIGIKVLVCLLMYVAFPLIILSLVATLCSFNYRKWLCKQKGLTKLHFLNPDRPLFMAGLTLLLFIPCALAFIVDYKIWPAFDLSSDLTFVFIGIILIVYFVFAHSHIAKYFFKSGK